MNDYANSFALIPLLTARLLRTRQNSFEVAKVDNEIAALKTLHITVYEVANLVDVLLVDVAANCITDFLKQNLLGCLCSDAAELFHRQRQEERVSQFNFFARQLASFFHR